MATITTKEVIQSSDVFTGNVHACVTLVCFVDYESVECARLNKVLNQILSDYDGKVRINIRHFPMANKHQKAMKAAEAAVAAAQEGLFWPMNNILFKNQKALGTISLKHYAKEIGTQNKRFLEQVINGIYAWQVREDLLEGLEKGVRSAPAVFLNGELFNEDICLETLSKKVEDFL
ncbi:MAG: oxidoreductase [Segetibacter sp.]|jgi:protein-disulfide isomerase|nr:oxidoreductase [Segetibacter sp.]